ncbi:MAG: sigma 54-interacting transcriptional regulator [Desulfohalobiaceae bacterium]|nr:sigma 54-interacting transcriptional regulator [Desulfohalobiaceae bacterium]
MERLLREAPARFFELVLNAFENGVFIVDRTGIVVFSNQAARQILALDASRLDDTHLANISAKAWKDFQKIMHSGRPQIGIRYQINNQALYVNRSPVVQAGQVIGVVSVFQKYTDLEKVVFEMEAYKRTVKELNTIIQSTYDGLYITDGQGITTRVNPAWERITGLKPEDVLGKSTRDLEKEGYVSRFVTPMILKEKKPVSLQAKTHSKRDVLVSGNPVFDDQGEVSMVVTTVRDLTEIRSLSRQLQQAKKLTAEYQEKLDRLNRQFFQDESIIAESGAMHKVLDLAAHIAPVSTPILITGETGVGKEVVARFIHQRSHDCAQGPFLKINCGAIPDNLLEAELFGYEPGAFTGASPRGKAGLFEAAEGGSLVLDEIGELSLPLQSKLLTVLQDYELTRVGGVKKKAINVRFIFITNKNLENMVQQSTFREDLYYRLNVVPLHLPPLKARKEDIPGLLTHFLEQFNGKYKRSVRLSPAVMDRLCDYPWPGNVRELKHLIERLVVLGQDEELSLTDLPAQFHPASLQENTQEQQSLKQAVTLFENQLITKTITRLGSIQKAAEQLRVNPATLYRKLQRSVR